ncbi:unnamed protein product [Phyllotreta striolata]|uniref:ribonuclease III n=1 Tax=Phyllotreta striolata TaxID=444603 RepID=A0A9N9XSW4_PHYSR|nr:unnamed protein product [Phyllotreta striolata]
MELELIPRCYQLEMMKIALEKNTIIYLPTGSGKTYIALMVLKSMSEPLTRSYNDGGKVTFFLVNTVALVDQHTAYLRSHTNFKVGRYSGEMNLDGWSKSKWLEEINKHQIIVMTCQILVNLVIKNFIDLNKSNLLIFDECHRGVKDHMMRQLMKVFEMLNDPPRVLGLTATLLNGNCEPSRVMDEVVFLEETYHSKVATVEELELVLQYSTNPNECFSIFETHVPALLETSVINSLREFQTLIKNTRIESMKFPIKLNGLVSLKSEKWPSKICNLIDDLVFHIDTLGIYGGYLACLSHIVQLERYIISLVIKRKYPNKSRCRLKKHCEDLKLFSILNSLQTKINYLGQKFKIEIDKYEKRESIVRCSSHKVAQLLNILKEYKAKSKEDLCCIIFTQRRFTAKLIYLLLKDLSESHPDFEYIKPNFLVGNRNVPINDTREALFINKMNKKVLTDFAQRELNVLVSSNILEEGIDIPTCTLVIRYDPAMDYRAYIQSKGRARHSKGFFYMMVNHSEMDSFIKKYNKHQAIENILNQLLIGKNDEREDPSLEKIQEMYEEDPLPPYYVKGTDGAQINMRTAISLLCQYCQSLPSDIFTVLVPDWFVKQTENDMYVVVVLLPTITNIPMVEGIPMMNKKLAKRAAAYVTCIRLHQQGEIDDHLFPRKRTVEPEDVEYLFTHIPKNDHKPSKKHNVRSLHKKLIPECVREQIRPATHVYLHIIQLQPEYNKRVSSINDSTLYDMQFGDSCYGLITAKPMPSLCDFPIYDSFGTIMVSLEVNRGTVVLTESDLSHVKRFHVDVLDGVLDVLKPFVLFDNGDEPEMMLLVPVDRESGRVDWDVLRKEHVFHQIAELSSSEKASLVVNRDTYLNKIVHPWYRRDNTTYLVTEVCESKNADSPFPDNGFSTFREYFQKRHNITLVNPALPLLLVKSVTKNVNFVKPKTKTAVKRKYTNEELAEYLPAELVVRQEFPGNLWIQAKFLPTVLSKISFILQIEELRCTIVTEKEGLGRRNVTVRRPLALDKTLLTYEPYTEDHHSELPPSSEEDTPISSLLKVNKDFNNKKLESQYPWKDIDEPIDIERNVNVSSMDIEHYEAFVNQRLVGSSRELKNIVPHASPQRLALTYLKTVDIVTIKLLELPVSEQEGPELCEFYRALTSAKANDIVNLERLETLGDSFIKYMTTVYIYLRFPQYDEGRSTALKGKMVSNRNLFYLARRRRITGCIRFHDVKKDDWLPPGMTVPGEMRRRIESEEMSVNALIKLGLTRDEQVTGELSDTTKEEILNNRDSVTDSEESAYYSMAPFLKSRYMSEKQVADAVEGLIGLHFKALSLKGAVRFIEWLGLIPESERLEELTARPPPPPALTSCALSSEQIRRHLPSYRDIERLIGYEFKDKGYLLQAMTHATYSPNRQTRSYERLEFAGDAVLDFLITCYIFENCEDMDPGRMTDLRSALVNNVTFASFLVRLGLHKYILFANMKLQSKIDSFANFMEQKNYVIDDEVLVLMEEDEVYMAESVDVPKVLGDVFEAVMGAVYFDSNFDLSKVWNIAYKIMWKEINAFCNNVPLNMVRVINERTSAHPTFGKSFATENGRTMVPLEFSLKGERKRVNGFGMNKAAAKRAAAKLALKMLNDARDN